MDASASKEVRCFVRGNIANKLQFLQQFIQLKNCQKRIIKMKKQVKLYFWFVLTVTITVSLGGCASKFKNISPADDFLQKKNVSIGLIWTSQANMHYPAGPEYTAKYYMLGQQGLLDKAVAHSFSDKLVTALCDIKLKNLMEEHYFNVFQRAFEDNNFNVKINPEPYCWKNFRLGTNEYCTNALETKNVELKQVGEGPLQTPIGCMVYNYKPVIADLGVDYLLSIDLIQHGTGRTYFAMSPTSPPQGYTLLVSYLIDGKTDKVISQHISSVVEPVQGEWDEPPEYTNLMKAAETSFEIAINEVFIDIFKQAP